MTKSTQRSGNDFRHLPLLSARVDALFSGERNHDAAKTHVKPDKMASIMRDVHIETGPEMGINPAELLKKLKRHLGLKHDWKQDWKRFDEFYPGIITYENGNNLDLRLTFIGAKVSGIRIEVDRATKAKFALLSKTLECLALELSPNLKRAGKVIFALLHENEDTKTIHGVRYRISKLSASGPLAVHITKPLEGIKVNKEMTHELDVLEARLRRIAKTIDKETNAPLRNFIWSLLHTGLTKEELLYLDWRDVDLDEGVIRNVPTKTGLILITDENLERAEQRIRKMVGGTSEKMPPFKWHKTFSGGEGTVQIEANYERENYEREDYLEITA